MWKSELTNFRAAKVILALLLTQISAYLIYLLILLCNLSYAILFVDLTLAETLTLNLLTTTIVAPPSNASKWQMGFNSAFKGLNTMNFFKNSKDLECRKMVLISDDFRVWNVTMQ